MKSLTTVISAVVLLAGCSCGMNSDDKVDTAMSVGLHMVPTVRSAIKSNRKAWQSELKQQGLTVTGPATKSGFGLENYDFAGEWEYFYVYSKKRKKYVIAPLQTAEPIVIVAVQGETIVWFVSYIYDAV